MANLEEKLTLRRRDFLKATGLTTAALIGADLLSSCTPKTPAAEIPEAPAAPTEDPNSQRASQIIKETVEKYPTIEVDFFGSALVAVANAHQIKTDILTTVVVSLFILYLILVFFYRNIFE